MLPQFSKDNIYKKLLKKIQSDMPEEFIHVYTLALLLTSVKIDNHHREKDRDLKVANPQLRSLISAT